MSERLEARSERSRSRKKKRRGVTRWISIEGKMAYLLIQVRAFTKSSIGGARRRENRGEKSCDEVACFIGTGVLVGTCFSRKYRSKGLKGNGPCKGVGILPLLRLK